jgi:hypothetical protein
VSITAADAAAAGTELVTLAKATGSVAGLTVGLDVAQAVSVAAKTAPHATIRNENDNDWPPNRSARNEPARAAARRDFSAATVSLRADEARTLPCF